MYKSFNNIESIFTKNLAINKNKNEIKSPLNGDKLNLKIFKFKIKLSGKINDLQLNNNIF